MANAIDITFSPYSTVSSTNVQYALQELCEDIDAQTGRITNIENIVDSMEIEIDDSEVLKAIQTSAYNSTSTSFADLPGLTQNLGGSRTYRLRATIRTTSNVLGGIKLQITGTATYTTLLVDAFVLNGALIASQTRATALNTGFANVTAVTGAVIVLDGTLIVDSPGTIQIQGGSNAAVGTTSFLAGNLMTLELFP